jgi:blue copper oxidase
MDLGCIDHSVTVDTTEIWEVRNASSNPHNFHVHGVQFKLATHAGSARPPYLAGWKDTAYILPGTTTSLPLRFTQHTDPAVPYLFHCHLMRHEDNRMMGQFVVVNPGKQASKPLSHHHR